MKKKYVETFVTMELIESSPEMTDEQMENFEKGIPEFREEVKTNIERIVNAYICANPDKMDVKVKVFLHE